MERRIDNDENKRHSKSSTAVGKIRVSHRRKTLKRNVELTAYSVCGVTAGEWDTESHKQDIYPNDFPAGTRENKPVIWSKSS